MEPQYTATTTTKVISAVAGSKIFLLTYKLKLKVNYGCISARW